jgi:hypothetical protein
MLSGLHLIAFASLMLQQAASFWVRASPKHGLASLFDACSLNGLQQYETFNAPVSKITWQTGERQHAHVPLTFLETMDDQFPETWFAKNVRIREISQTRTIRVPKIEVRPRHVSREIHSRWIDRGKCLRKLSRCIDARHIDGFVLHSRTS